MITTPPNPTKIFHGTYLGDGTLNRQITGIGFRPDLVIIIDTEVGTIASVNIKSAKHAGSNSKWTTATVDDDGIASLDADGFTLTGSDVSYINNPNPGFGRLYVFIAFKGFYG